MLNERAVSRQLTSATVLFFLAGWMGVALAASAVTPRGAPDSVALYEPARQADIYYQQRQDAENVRKAITLLRHLTAKNPQDYEAWWRLAMCTNFLARRATGTPRSSILRKT